MFKAKRIFSDYHFGYEDNTQANAMIEEFRAAIEPTVRKYVDLGYSQPDLERLIGSDMMADLMYDLRIEHLDKLQIEEKEHD